VGRGEAFSGGAASAAAAAAAASGAGKYTPGC